MSSTRPTRPDQGRFDEAIAAADSAEQYEALRWSGSVHDWANTELPLRLKVHPPFDRLRDAPRYRDLRRRMDLEP